MEYWISLYTATVVLTAIYHPCLKVRLFSLYYAISQYILSVIVLDYSLDYTNSYLLSVAGSLILILLTEKYFGYEARSHQREHVGATSTVILTTGILLTLVNLWQYYTSTLYLLQPTPSLLSSVWRLYWLPCG